LNDGDIPSLLARAREAGATSASMTLLRLPREVLPVFMERLGAAFPPERARRVENAIRDVRGGRLDEPAFGARMRGLGPRWDAVDQLFETHARRLGLWSSWQAVEEPSTFRRPPAPAPPRQGSLFDE
jgi:DNA repair photolyase